MTALIIIASIMGYIGMAGATTAVAQQVLERRCKEDFHWRYSEYDKKKVSCQYYHYGGSIPCGIFWPVVIPFSSFYYAGNLITNAKLREASRQRRELEKAKHRVEVAKLNAEAIALAEQSVLKSDAQM